MSTWGMAVVRDFRTAARAAPLAADERPVAVAPHGQPAAVRMDNRRRWRMDDRWRWRMDDRRRWRAWTTGGGGAWTTGGGGGAWTTGGGGAA